MKKPDFQTYSGPYNIGTEAITRLADFLDEVKCAVILSKYGIDVIRIIGLDEDGSRKRYQDPLYVLVTKDEDQPKPGKYLRLGTIIKICELLSTGEIDVQGALDYGVDASLPQTETESQESDQDAGEQPTDADQTEPGGDG